MGVSLNFETGFPLDFEPFTSGVFGFDHQLDTAVLWLEHTRPAMLADVLREMDVDSLEELALVRRDEPEAAGFLADALERTGTFEWFEGDLYYRP